MAKKKENTKPTTKPHGNSKLDAEKAVELRNRGWTLKEIGDKYGVTQSAVHQRIAHMTPDPKELAEFRKNQGDVWLSTTSRILKHVTDEKLAECTAYQLMGMAGIANQNTRLIEGKSTANHEAIISSAMDIVNKRDELK